MIRKVMLQRNQSTRARFLLTFPFAPEASTLEKYSSEPLGSAFIVLLPSVQFAGQTSPCSSCVREDAESDNGPAAYARGRHAR